MRKVAIFCGASSGFKSIYKEKAAELGAYFATNNIAMVFGGGKIGMMGAIADAMLKKKGKSHRCNSAFITSRRSGTRWCF